MAIEFIRNQPIMFEDDTDDTNVTYNRDYGILAQQDDRLYVQMKQTACGADLLCGITDTVQTLVQNGTFTGSATGWTLGTGWSYGGDKVSKTVGNTNVISQSAMPFVVGNTYLVTYTLTRTAGSIRVVLGDGAGATQGTIRNSSGTYAESLVWNDTVDPIIQFLPDAAFVGDIDDVIVTNNAADCLDYSPTQWDYTGTLITHVSGTGAITLTPAVLSASGYYRVDITVLNMTAGSLLLTIGDDVSNTITGNGIYSFYALSGAGTALTFTPTTDFDGSISALSAYTLSRDFTITIIDENNIPVTTAYDSAALTDPIVYYKEYITWSVTLNNITNVLLVDTALPIGCYRLKVYDDCTATTHIQVNTIRYAGVSPASYQYSKLVKGLCSGYAFGFEFTNSGFALQQRLRMTWFAPKYAIAGETNFTSSGTLRKLYSERQKLRTAMIDYVDEFTHDTISLQINCDTLTIDGVAYFSPVNDYTPEWESNGRRNLAQSRIELQYSDDVLFNKNC